MAEWPVGFRRSQTDGGPVMAESEVDATLARWREAAYVAVAELDGSACGAVSLTSNAEGAELSVIVGEPSLWHQGIGGRLIDLAVHAAFQVLSIQRLLVRGLREDATPARLAFEHAGFGQERRSARDSTSPSVVVGDWSLSKLAYEAQEQRVYLVCAGESQRAVAGVLTGWDDPALSPLGRAQAEALAGGALLNSVSEAVCSDLRRSRATAERALATRGIPVTRDEAWRCQDLGAFTGRQRQDLAAGFELAPPDGESMLAFEERLRSALAGLPRGGDVAVVTHNDAIALLLRSLQPDLAAAPGLGSGRGISNGSVSELRRGVGGWRIIRISDERHLVSRAATVDLLGD